MSYQLFYPHQLFHTCINADCRISRTQAKNFSDYQRLYKHLNIDRFQISYQMIHDIVNSPQCVSIKVQELTASQHNELTQKS